MNRGTYLNLIQGLGPISTGHKCSHFLYADDTIFFLPADSGIIENVKWALVAFESLTGIKVNYDKIEMMPMNLTGEENHQYGALIGYNISHFPIIYFGLSLHDRTLRVSDWNGVVAKIRNKLENWKGTLLSLGGRLIMVNIILFAVPLYMLSLYKLHVKVRKKINTIRCRFFWQGSSNHRKKIALIA
jgi:hypothetical protein